MLVIFPFILLLSEYVASQGPLERGDFEGDFEGGDFDLNVGGGWTSVRGSFFEAEYSADSWREFSGLRCLLLCRIVLKLEFKLKNGVEE